MVKYCSECGAKLNDDDKFCRNCGNSQNDSETNNSETDSNNKNKLIIIGILAIIVILSALFITTFKSNTELTILTESPITGNDEFRVELSSSDEGISAEEIHIIFAGSGTIYEYDVTTDSGGIAKIMPNIPNGEYEVTCIFNGDKDYSKSNTTKSLSIEPDYMSYSYPQSFEDTDKNNDGYVDLSDMNIAHTPKSIQNQMFSDSDNDHDGRLNKNEYYKFMYKLNYDKQKYGL